MTEEKPRARVAALLRFAARQPFALLGAVGLLSLAKDLLEFREWIAAWIDAFQTVTRPVWEFLLGRLMRLAGLTLPDLAKDYLTAGVIVFGMAARAKLVLREGPMRGHAPALAAFFVQCLLFWPLVFFIIAPLTSLALRRDGDETVRLYGRVFWESGVWVLIILAVNYALLGGKA